MNTLTLLVEQQFSTTNSVIMSHLHMLMEVTCHTATFDPAKKAQYEHAIHELASFTRLSWPANISPELVRKAYFDKHGALFLEFLLSMVFWLTLDQRNPDRALTPTAAEALHWALDVIEDDLFNTQALQQLLATMCVHAALDEDLPDDADRIIASLRSRLEKLPAFIYIYIENATTPPDPTTQEQLAKAARRSTYYLGQIAIMARLAWPTESELLFECLDQLHIDQISESQLEEWHQWFFKFPEHPHFERDLLRFYQKLPEPQRHQLIESLGEQKNKEIARHTIPVLAELAVASYDTSHLFIANVCRAINDRAVAPLCSWLAQHGHYTAGSAALDVVLKYHDGSNIRAWAQHVQDASIRDRVFALKPTHATHTDTSTAQRLSQHTDPTGWSFEHKQLLALCDRANKGDKGARIKLKDTMLAELIRATAQHQRELTRETDLTNMMLMASLLGSSCFQDPSPVTDVPNLQRDATALLVEMCSLTDYEDVCYVACDSLFELTRRAGFSLTDAQRKALNHQIFGRIWNDVHNHQLATLALPFSSKHWQSFFNKHRNGEAPEQHRYILGVETNDTITTALHELYIEVKPPQRRQLFRHIDQYTHPSHLPLLAQFIDQVTPSTRKILLEGIVQIDHMAIEPILLNVLQQDNQDPQVMQVAVKGLQAAGTRLSLATLMKIQKSTNGTLNLAATTAISSIERRYPASEINAGQGALTLDDQEAWRGALSTTTNATEGMMSLYQDVRQIVHHTSKPEQPNAIRLASNHHIGINHVPAPPRDVPMHVLMLYMFFQNNTYGFYIFWVGLLIVSLSLPLRLGIQLPMGVYVFVMFLGMIVNYVLSNTKKSIHLLEHGFMGEARLMNKETATNEADKPYYIYTFQIEGEDGNVYDTNINTKTTLHHLEDDPTEIALYAVDESGKVTDMQLLDQHKLIRINDQGQMRPTITAFVMMGVLMATFLFLYLF